MTNKEKSELQEKIISSLEYRSHGRLLLAPRSGKTKLIIDLIKRDKPVSILWVTPTAELANIDIPSEFYIWKAKSFKKRLTTSTWKSLGKVKGFFDLIILDEEQYITKNNSKTLISKELQYGNIISMTGTETKHKDKLAIYEKLNLKVLYQININTAVDIGLLSNYEIKVVLVPLNKERNFSVKTKNKSFTTSEEKQYRWIDSSAETAIYKREKSAKFKVMARMKFIQNSPSKLKAAQTIINAKQGRKLIFSSNVNQAEQLCNNLYHSKTDSTDLEAFKKGEISSIAMVNKGGTGYTYKAIDHLFITQADSDKNGLTSQKITRTLLGQKNYKAMIWIFALEGTRDIDWVSETLKSFDKEKVEFIKF